MLKKQTVFILLVLVSSWLFYSVVSGNEANTNWQDIYRQYIFKEQKGFNIYDIDKDGIPEFIDYDGNKLSIYIIRDGAAYKAFEDETLAIESIRSRHPLYVGDSVIFYATRDNQELALYYTISKGYPKTYFQNGYEEIKVFKLTLNEGMFDINFVGDIHREYLVPMQSPFISQTYRIQGEIVSEHEFLTKMPLGARLDFRDSRNPTFGWGPILSAIPHYTLGNLYKLQEMLTKERAVCVTKVFARKRQEAFLPYSRLPIETLFQRYFDQKLYTSGVLYPNISNPFIAISGFYYNIRFTEYSIEDSVMILYPNNLIDLNMPSENEKTSINLMLLNGNFASGINVLQYEDQFYIPLRIVCETLGYQVGWMDGTAIISDNGRILDKLNTKIPGNSYLVEGRLYVPMDYFKNLVCNVQFGSELFTNQYADIQLISIEQIFDKAFTISP